MFHQAKRRPLCTNENEEVCPMRDRCSWRGDGVLNHMKERHPECIKTTNTFQLKLKETVDIRSVLNDAGKKFYLEVKYNGSYSYYQASTEIKFKLVELGLNTDNDNIKYTVHMRSPDNEEIKESIVLQVAKSEFSISDKVLEFFSSKVVAIEIRIRENETLSEAETAISNVLECPVCKDTMKSTKIRQCRTGHSFCEDCIEKLQQCPLCQQELTNTINYGLMQLHAKVYRPCKNKEIGCGFVGFPKQLVQHEAFCVPYECPFKIVDNCTFGGDKEELMRHCLATHRSEVGRRTNKVCMIENGKYIGSPDRYVMCAYNNIFRIFTKHTNNDAFWTVKLYGSTEEAQRYRFLIKIKEGAKEVMFADDCKSVTDKTDVANNGLRISLMQMKSLWPGHICTITIEGKK